MLSEREQDTLLEMQRQLVADDPNFERSFQTLDAVTPAAQAKHPRASSVIIAITAGIAVVMLLAGSAVGAFCYAVIAGLVRKARDLPDNAAREKHHG